MPGIQCPITGCDYITPDTTPEITVVLLQLNTKEHSFSQPAESNVTVTEEEESDVEIVAPPGSKEATNKFVAPGN